MMDDITEEVLDKMAGRKTESAAMKQARRRKVWYGRWNDLADFLEGKPSTKEILFRVHQLINNAKGYRYDQTAYSSELSLKLLCSDRRLK